jgi:hypothetical protein
MTSILGKVCSGWRTKNQVGRFSSAYGPDVSKELLDMTKFRAK